MGQNSRSMKITSTMIEPELYESVAEDNQTVSIDMRPKGKKSAQSPTELLLSALSGCVAVDIVTMLQKRKKTVSRFTITVDGTRQEEHPRYFTKIHSHYTITSPDVQQDELYKVSALALEKYCSVGASLRSELTFSVEVQR